MTAPGIPMLFQGQEFLEDEWFHDQDPLDWSKATTHAGILQLYRDLIALRRDVQGVSRGLSGHGLHVFHRNDHDKVLAFHRWEHGGPRDSVVVLMNFGHRAFDVYRLGFPAGGTWRVRLNSDWVGYDSSFGNQKTLDVDAVAPGWDGLPFRGEIGLGPYSAAILSQDHF